MTVEPDRDGTAVLLVAHGSRDPRAARATRALSAAVAAARPGWDVHAAFLEHSRPRPVPVLTALESAGHRRAVLVPLLLTAAYHGRVDVPAEVAAAHAAGLRIEVAVADVLGPRDAHVDPLLLGALTRRVHEAAPGADAVVLAAAGTRDGAARGTVGRTAAALGAHLGVPCTVAYASAAPPDAGAAVRRLRAAGARRVMLAAYFLAPGLLYDATIRAAMAAGAVATAAPLGDGPELVRLVLARVESAARDHRLRHAAGANDDQQDAARGDGLLADHILSEPRQFRDHFGGRGGAHYQATTGLRTVRAPKQHDAPGVSSGA